LGKTGLKERGIFDKHTHGYVKDFPESLVRSRTAQISKKIAQLRINFNLKVKDFGVCSQVN